MTIDGIERKLVDIARTCGINKRILYQRIFRDGWSPERAMSVPPDGRSRRNSVTVTHERMKLSRNGAGNFTETSKLVAAQNLRDAGLSLRAIAKMVGLHRDTVMRYVTRVSRSDAMKRKHVQWKTEGRPVLPPWRRTGKKK